MLRIVDAVYEVFPDLKSENPLLIYRAIVHNAMAEKGWSAPDMDEIKIINQVLDILSHKNALAKDLLETFLTLTAFTHSQLFSKLLPPDEFLPKKSKPKSE